MSIRSFAAQLINRSLSPFDLCLTRHARDFDFRLDDPRLLNRMLLTLADAIDGWLDRQTLFERSHFDAEAMTSDFYKQYVQTPFRDRIGGSRFNNLLWLCAISRAKRPSVIIDSGTHKGASAWALKFGWPQADVYSFDIDLSRLSLRERGVEYIESDWGSFDFGERAADGLCYFDDHVDQAKRLIEASNKGFQLLIFDDDFSVQSVAEMAHRGEALPKIEFLLDDELRDFSEIVWQAGRSRFSWKVDANYLNHARSLIADTERLPDTSFITGIYQTPYRVLVCTKSSDRAKPGAIEPFRL